jgi:hypothetical protein
MYYVPGDLQRPLATEESRQTSASISCQSHFARWQANSGLGLRKLSCVDLETYDFAAFIFRRGVFPANKIYHTTANTHICYFCLVTIWNLSSIDF